MTRCPGSGQRQMLSWPPTEEDGYPGAVVCIECDLGIQVRKGSVREDESESGWPGYSGIVKVHDKPKEDQP